MSDKPSHYCPDWDYDWILEGSPEMECCTCSRPVPQTTGHSSIDEFKAILKAWQAEEVK